MVSSSHQAMPPRYRIALHRQLRYTQQALSKTNLPVAKLALAGTQIGQLV
jgi:hypothetical protein